MDVLTKGFFFYIWIPYFLIPIGPIVHMGPIVHIFSQEVLAICGFVICGFLNPENARILLSTLPF